jgi:phosphohistidine phosphatase
MQRSLRGARVAPVTHRRRLIVMRHAKAEPFASSDRARRLTDRGLAAALDMGTYLRDRRLLPDYAVVSSAVRTRQTWAAVVETSGVTGCEVSFDDAVFNGSAEVVLEALRAVPPTAGTVMFVGHNPSAAFVCHSLDDGDGDADAVAALLQGFPPAAMALLEVSVPWDQLGPATGRVVGNYVGRG